MSLFVWHIVLDVCRVWKDNILYHCLFFRYYCLRNILWPSFCETCALCRAWWILEKDGIALRNETLSPQYGQVTTLHSWYVEVNTTYRERFILSDGSISSGLGLLLTITAGMETQLNLVKNWNSIHRQWNIPDSSHVLTFLKLSHWTKYVKPLYLHISMFRFKFTPWKEF